MISRHQIFQDTAEIKQVTSKLSFSDYWDHTKARWRYKRSKHRVKPGLYSIGNPDQESPVFVTANYTLSFDSLRKGLKEIDSYILVLDTKGINVWCAAGKGTFGTDELVNRIDETNLKSVVKHRKLILPQLGAPGVAAHLVKQKSGFNVEFGPVRAKDIVDYIKFGKVSTDMRKVNFNLLDRLTLIPVEIVGYSIPLFLLTIIFYLIGGMMLGLGVAVSILTAVILFPILLPWLPTHNFSTKGFILGLIATLPFGIHFLISAANGEVGINIMWAISYLLLLPTITSFITLNFTGATTFTSRSGVKREIYTFIPKMAWMFGGGLLLAVSLRIVNFIGG